MSKFGASPETACCATLGLGTSVLCEGGGNWYVVRYYVRTACIRKQDDRLSVADASLLVRWNGRVDLNRKQDFSPSSPPRKKNRV